MTDPAARAASAPEAADPVDPVLAVGIGPGDPSFLTDRASAAIADADVLTGFETVLDRVPDRAATAVLPCSYDDQSAVLATFAERVAGGARGVAAFWGDPTVSGFQFLGRIEAALDRPVRILPGVSSVQIAAARARTPIERATIASLHRRGDVSEELDRLEAAAATGDHLIVLVRPYDWMPPVIARELIDRGVGPEREALVAQELTLSGESIDRRPLGDLAGADRSGDAYSDRTILVVRAP